MGTGVFCNFTSEEPRPRQRSTAGGRRPASAAVQMEEILWLSFAKDSRKRAREQRVLPAAVPHQGIPTSLLPHVLG